MNFHNVEFAASYGMRSQLPLSDRGEIAFSGRSNVGKSSLINKLLGRRNFARVSSTPGKTATINFYHLPPLYLVDLPGYGYAKVAKTEQRRWSELIEGYFASPRQLGMVFQLIDFRHPPSKDDLLMLGFLKERGFSFTVVLTKADKLSRTERDKRMADLPSELPYADLTIIPFSAKTGEGVEELRALIEALA